jgi:signal transduction histidine kinase
MRPALPQTLRARLAAISAAVAAAAITSGAIATYVLGKQQLIGNLDRSLEARAVKVAATLEKEKRIPADEPFVQVVSSAGVVITSAAIGEGRSLLTLDQIQFGFSSQFFVDRDVPSIGRARILTTPADIEDRRWVIVVATSRQELEDNIIRLRLGLILGSPLLAATVGFGVWLVVGATLRPVRRMTDEAAVISGANLDRRLAVPPGGDELAHLGTTLNDMLSRIEDSFRRERSFVDDASHELRTPLAIMRGEIELALGGDPSSPDRATLESLREEVERLAALADDLLVLARVDSARAAIGCSDVCTSVAGIVDRLGTALRHPITVETIGSPRPARVSSGALERITTNLLGNADRYATSRITVHISEEQTAIEGSRPGVVMAVSDDGPGFPIPFLGRAFERFAVPDPSRGRSKSGTGLGLAIVQELAKAVGGSATAANLNGDRTGAVVTVRLPLADEGDRPMARSFVRSTLPVDGLPAVEAPAATAVRGSTAVDAHAAATGSPTGNEAAAGT